MYSELSVNIYFVSDRLDKAWLGRSVRVGGERKQQRSCVKKMRIENYYKRVWESRLTLHTRERRELLLVFVFDTFFPWRGLVSVLLRGKNERRVLALCNGEKFHVNCTRVNSSHPTDREFSLIEDFWINLITIGEEEKKVNFSVILCRQLPWVRKKASHEVYNSSNKHERSEKIDQSSTVTPAKSWICECSAARVQL